MSAVPRRLGLLAAASLLPLAACQGADDAPEPARAAASLAPVECPPQVDDVMMGDYSCAIADHQRAGRQSSGRAPGDHRRAGRWRASDDPLIVVGADLAAVLNYAGLAPPPTGSNGRS